MSLFKLIKSENYMQYQQKIQMEEEDHKIYGVTKNYYF